MPTWRPRTTDLRATNCWVVAAWSERRTQLLRGSRALQNRGPGLSASSATRWLGITHPTSRHHRLLIQKTEITGASISKDRFSLKKWESAEKPGMETGILCVHTQAVCSSTSWTSIPAPWVLLLTESPRAGTRREVSMEELGLGWILKYWKCVKFPRTELKKKKKSKQH